MGRLGAMVVALDQDKIDQGHHYGWWFEKGMLQNQKRSNKNSKDIMSLNPKNDSIRFLNGQCARQNEGK